MQAPSYTLPSPESIKVEDHTSLNLWCASMQLNKAQAASLFSMTIEEMDGCLMGSSNLPPLLPTVCQLISQKPPKERMAWLCDRLSESQCDSIWPAEHPLIVDN